MKSVITVSGLLLASLLWSGVPVHAQSYGTMTLASDGKCLDINAASNRNGVQVQQWSCNGTVAQDFKFVVQPNGTFEIRTRTGNNLCVDVQAGNPANGTRVQQYECNGSPAQRFSLQARDGGYNVRPVVAPQSCLDLSYNGVKDGDKLIEYACTGGKNQLFKINLAAVVPAAPAVPDIEPSVISVTSPSAGNVVAGSVQIKGVAGSNWKNVAVYDVDHGYAKVASDVVPSKNAFTLTMDSTKLRNGDIHLAIIAFSVAAGATGGTSQAVNLSLRIDNAVPVVTRPGPIAGPEFANYAVTFEDTFASLTSISLGSAYDGAKWYNGTEQCCMVDSTGLPGVMFPTLVNGVQSNPYTLLPGGGLGIALDKKNNVWFSGVLTSVDAAKKGFTQQYGYFEMKAKMPAGDGVWPAFWMLSTRADLPGEIDMLEYYGHDNGSTYGITLHDWRNGGNNHNIADPIAFPKVSGMVTGFHTYGMLWTESTMTFYFDGQQVWQHATPEVMKQPYYLLLNNGLGGYWPTTATPDHSVFEVEYIRAYGPSK